MFTIRNETQADHQAVETITRRAFYNLYVPGCGEHYLVHIMRDHPDFIPELDFVAELDGRRWVYRDSPVMGIDEGEAQRYDDTLEPMERKHLPNQEEFYIMSHSFVEEEQDSAG